MANVRCPMCSKLNPPEAEICAYCGARIKPLRVSPSDQPGAESSSPNDEPDWLKELRTDQPGSQAGEGAPDNAMEGLGEGSDVPDWLSRIRDRARTETTSESDLFGENQEEADWLQGNTSPDQGLDDWLSRMPGGETAEPGQAAPTDQSRLPGEPTGMETSGAGLEPADWLRGLSDDSLSESQGDAQTGADNIPAFDFGTSTGADAGEDDWMSKLSTWQAGFTEDETKPASLQPGASEAEDEYGWLNSLGAEGEAPSGLPEPGISSGTDLPGFLSGFEGSAEEQPFTTDEPPAVFSEEGGIEWNAPETPSSYEKPTSGFGLTGFLSQIEEPDAAAEPAPSASEGSEEIFTGWDQPAEAASSAASGDMPAWISGETSTEPVESTAQTGEPGVPDWLRGLENDAEQSADAAGAGDAAAGIAAEYKTGVPDWLQGSDSEATSETTEPFEAGPSGLPAWLSSDAETPSQPEEQPFVQPHDQPQVGKSDLPAWLFSDETPPEAAPTEAGSGEPAPGMAAPGMGAPEIFEPGDQTPAFSSAVEENLPAAAEMPDWLSGEFAPTGEGTAEEIPAAEPAEADAGLPDWFASFDQSEVEKTQPNRVTGGLKPANGQLPPLPTSAQELSQGDEPVEEAEGPDWLRDFQGQKEEETGAPVSPLLSSARALDSAGKEGDQPFTVDLPEWLGEDEVAQRAEVQPSDTGLPPLEPAGEQLAQADLPDWVRDMRPLESIIPGEAPERETDQRVEKAGPLAGMRGVLPVEDMATRYRKPPVYSIKLHVTEKQRTQAALLESILSQESQSLLIPPARALGPGALMRVLLTVLILVALAFPVIFEVGLLAAPAPNRFPAENQMFEEINENLQSSTAGPVLLAVEYEAGLSGEMRMIASGVVEQLVENNARIVLVSTVAAGPALGQQLLDDVSEDYSQRVNLGYLPGGTISLVGFAHQPSWAAPATLENQPAWGAGALLEDVNGLGEFSQVIVLTDRAEVGRAWVEQVQPQLGDVPLFMVASAQAAPLLQPYVDSGQIAGMTSGMLGGAMYAQLAGQSNSRVLTYLSAYQIGIVLAFVIVLVGGLVSGGMALFKRGDREEE